MTTGIPQLIRETAIPLDDISADQIASLVDRVGDARVVLLGEASHGTAEFYRMRAVITRELITRKGFTFVAAEADWPDAAAVDRYVRHASAGPPDTPVPFTRFPTWMWRNTEVEDFVAWLRAWNADRPAGTRAGFHGLDIYSMYTSMSAVLRYLDGTDPALARVARERYACLTPWQDDPAAYGHAATRRGLAACEAPVLAMLQDLLRERFALMEHDGERFFDAERNARVVASAEQYYRLMYGGAVASWNLRDGHMFETLQALLEHYGPESRAVVWAHNSHVGNAEATAMGARGEHNIGSLCRWSFGDGAVLVGFGTDHGTVAAASNWDEPMEIKRVRPARQDSYEYLCHETGVEAFLLHLSPAPRDALREELASPRLERAIGVIYRPETELQSHYFPAVLPAQFDAWIWFDETSAVTPLPAQVEPGLPETWPFGV